jgi:putative colanic acid biosynthesis UDP-glucose lipid carrier transferase
MPRDCADVILYALDEGLEGAARHILDCRLKRLLDLVGAGFGLIFLFPFLLLVGVIIYIDNPGPVLFRQTRSGLNGARFTIYKFRTMRVLDDGPTVVQATRDDRRMTRCGAFLRRTSIDELPNLLNVFRGEMSLVGPRPHAVAHDEYFGAMLPGYAARYLAKPGITGLAQVAGLRGRTADIGSMAARVENDIAYIRRWSLKLDIELLLRTVLGGPFHPAAY